MNKYSYYFTFWLFGLLLSLPSQAQYITPAPLQDGSVSDAEYGNTTVNGFSTNKFTSADGGVWYMTWDANYLYVAKTGGENYQPTILYFDVNPLLPVTGGGPAQGNLNGVEDYQVVPKLPFRGDARVYAENGNIEVRRALDTGGWSGPITTGVVSSSPNVDKIREFRISWNTLTGNNGIPPSFNWLGYAINNNSGPTNYRYDQAPANPGAAGSNGGTTPPLEYYNTVISTGNGTATPPFSLKSYTFLGTTDATDFGAIDVWDFTMNSPGLSIKRSSSLGGNWNIGGSLVVNAGTIFFGSSGSNYGDTNVGNIRVLGGVLKMDQTTKPLYVREDVNLTGGGQFLLSGTLGVDLYVGRDFLVTNGTTVTTTTPATFQANDRAVVFTGNSVAHRIRANNSYVVPFPYLTLNTPSGTVTLDSNIALGQLLTFTNGLLVTGSNFVLLDGAGRLGTETTASHIVGNARITKGLDPVMTTDFGNLGLRIIPQNGAAAQGDVVLTRVTGTTLAGVGMGSNSNSIQRYFQLSAAGTSFANPNYLVEFAYRLDELNSTPESNLALYRSVASANGPYSRLTTPPSANTSTHTITYNSQVALAPTTYFTLADGVTPLPVTLVSFTAQATPQGTALLRWATASETNSKGFGIERQLTAGGAWQPVGYVAAANLATGSTYAFTDGSLAAAPASGKAYYRLRQEDLDGTLSYSPVAVIARLSLEAGQLVLSPVPVSGASLSVAFAEAGQAGSAITVLNTQGQRLLHFTTEASSTNALSVPVEKLAPGVYIVQVQVPGQSPRYARFVKQ